MKIRKLLMVFVLSIVTLATTLMTIQPTYAYESADDLINDSNIVTSNATDIYVVELLSNATYEFVISIDSAYLQDVSAPEDYEIETVLGGDDFYIGSMEADYWASYYGTTPYTEQFTTTSATTFELYFYHPSGSSMVDPILNFFDIQLYLVSQNGSVDEVPPTYTYTNLSIDTPYHDLVTESEIRSQLSATDPEEGDVTSRIQVYNDAYTSETITVGGSYYIMYMVDDTAGNSAYLQVDINVIDDVKPYATYNSTTYSDGSSLTLSWFDDAAATSQYTLSEIQSLFAFEDDYYSSGELTVTTSCIGYDETVPGTYAVNIEIEDPSGNIANITVNVTVYENANPVISGSSALNVEVTDVNINDILAQYTGSDTEDGNLSVVVDNTNTWDYTNPIIGSFNLILSVTDSFGIETLKTVAITVEDTTNPVFKIDGIESNTYTHNLYMSDTTTLQTLIDNITVIDSWYGDITADIVVPTYPEFETPGSTLLTLTCTDASGNQGSLDLTVVVIDDIAPVINGATKVVKGLTSTLALSDITAELTATDNVDGIISVSVVSDGYTGNNSVIGSYVVQYSATDSAGNVTLHEVRVWVVDNQAPAWVYNDYFIEVTPGETISRTDLVSLMQDAGMIGSDISYTVTFVSDEYTDHEDITGAYEVVMNVTYEDGSEEVISVMLNVPEAAAEDDVIEVEAEEDLTGFQKLWNNIKSGFQKVWNGLKTAAKAIWNGIKWVVNNIIVPAWEFFFEPDDVVVPDDYTDNTTEELPAEDTSSTPELQI